jgi:type II secretory pathway pseudopilin PulG
LVELVVGMALLSLMVAMTMRVSGTIIAGFRDQRGAMGIERNARSTLDMLADAVRSASPGVVNGDVRDVAGCTSAIGLSVTNRNDGPDSIDLIFASGGGLTAVRSPVTGATAAFAVAGDVGFAAGDSAVVTDGSVGRLVQILAITPSLGESYFSITPPNIACPLVPMPVMQAGSLVVRAQVARFFVDTTFGLPLLMLDPDGDGPRAAEPFAEGIEDMQLAVGVDVDGDGIIQDAASTTDEWFYNVAGDPDPPPITDGGWRGLRISLVAADPAGDNRVEGSARPALADRAAGPVDGIRRRVMATTAEIRNLAGAL